MDLQEDKDLKAQLDLRDSWDHQDQEDQMAQ